MCEERCHEHHRHHQKQGRHHSHSLQRKGFVLPCLLLLLKKRPAHGYDLIEGLSRLPFLKELPDPGVVYRHLRGLESDGMIESFLEPGSGGPARKIYTLTPEGDDYLTAWANSIEKKKAALEDFLKTFKELN